MLPLTMASTRRETAAFHLGAALIGVRILDDTVLQPAAGTSVLDHPVSALVPLSLLALVAWAYPRIRGGAWRGLAALILGVLGIATGVDAVYYARETGLGSDDVTGFVAIAAGLGLLGLGAATLWRTRRRFGVRRLAFGLGALFVFPLAVMPAGIAYVMTHTARADVPADASASRTRTSRSSRRTA
jgi:MYXO-CTERM domain-containing protein